MNPYQSPAEPVIDDNADDDRIPAEELGKILLGFRFLNLAWLTLAVAVLALLAISVFFDSIVMVSRAAGLILLVALVLVGASPIALLSAGNRHGNRRYAAGACVGLVASLLFALVAWLTDTGAIVFLGFSCLCAGAACLAEYQRRFCVAFGLRDLTRRCNRLRFLIFLFWAGSGLLVIGRIWTAEETTIRLIVVSGFCACFGLMDLGGIPEQIIQAVRRRERLADRIDA